MTDRRVNVISTAETVDYVDFVEVLCCAIYECTDNGKKTANSNNCYAELLTADTFQSDNIPYSA